MAFLMRGRVPPGVHIIEVGWEADSAVTKICHAVGGEWHLSYYERMENGYRHLVTFPYTETPPVTPDIPPYRGGCLSLIVYGHKEFEMKKYSLFVGRYQPLHDGHKILIRTVLDEGKNVLVALRETGINENNPYSVEERKEMFCKAFPDEILNGRMCVISIPDIGEICYGRKVGYGIRQIKLSDEVESISATEIRNQSS